MELLSGRDSFTLWKKKLLTEGQDEWLKQEVLTDHHRWKLAW